MEEWWILIYEDIKEFYTIYTLWLGLFIGWYCIKIDARELKRKKLKKEMRICKGIGWTYIIGNICLYVILNIV